jgi:hypothetical protein
MRITGGVISPTSCAPRSSRRWRWARDSTIIWRVTRIGFDGVGGPIDLMRPGELHGRDGLGGHLVIPPYNYRKQ